MAVGDYERIEDARRRACRAARSLYDPTERAANQQRCVDLGAERERYLRDLLARLPFRWHVAHAYTQRETANYGGGDHIVVDEPIRIGRLVREPGDALSRPRRKFLALYDVEEGRLPTAIADIKIAERLVAAKKTPRQLEREIAEAIGKSRR